jgi:hypothetical protein
MAYDIALSENFDLVVTGSRDLAGIDGDDLIAQRIKTRLRIERGSWVLDDVGSLGSDIHQYFGSPSDKFTQVLPTLIRQALAEMDDIEIVDIVVTQQTTHQVLASIFFRRVEDTDIISADALGEQTVQEATVLIGTGG